MVFGTGSLCFFAVIFARVGGSQASDSFLVSASHFTVEILGLQELTTVLSFTRVLWLQIEVLIFM